MKKDLDELAIFGGEPIFDHLKHVGRPNIGNRENFYARVEDILNRNWLTNNGPYLKEFEHKLAEFLGVRNCIAMCNATIGLEIMARALGVQGQVIVPSFTFIATAHALQWQKINPVFCDVDPLMHNIDPEKIVSLITSETTAILGVHVWGRACNIEMLTKIASEHNLKLMFDAAHAFGCSYKGKMIGGFGDAEVFSFHATKFFNSFEGGAVTTNSDILADKIRRMRNFGFQGLDNVVDIGINGKMSEISAAMGLTSLDSLQDFILVNHENYLEYVKGLEGISGVRLVQYDEMENNNYQYIVIELDENYGGIDRNTLIEILSAENIKARRYFYPGCHQMEPYYSTCSNGTQHLLETEKLVKKVVQLPTGTAVSRDNVSEICSLIQLAINNSTEINRRLKKG
jgi:dTDP-4-amino-4,6-dideoxygalactose transaminase